MATRYPVSILVVDDNAVNRHLMVHVLRRVGYTNVQTASNGVISLDLVSKTPFDIIFLDLQMPHMDGFSTCNCIRNICQSRKQQPVIVGK